MGEKIIIGPINKGLQTNREPFLIDNDSFPVLINAYQWRGRVKRKRGTALLNRLKRFFNSTSRSYNSGATTIVLDGSGVGNILTGFSLQANGNIVPGSVTLTGAGGPFTDPTVDGYLTPTGTGGVNTINYSTGVVTIPAQAGNAYSVTFNYYPDLPVMGLSDFVTLDSSFDSTIAFDTKYSYNITTTFPYSLYDVSFYKNPTSASFVGYTQKAVWTPTSWNGQDYQQFWTVNYQGALWASNGVDIPFTGANIGMQFKAITGVVITAVGPPAIATLTIVAHGLFQGDFVYVNEVNGITGINFQTGYVVSADPQAANTVSVEFPNATLGGAYIGGGIAQYLTSRSDITKDCLRFYDGDPTDGNATTPVLSGTKGWVNFAPPLSQSNFSIADLPAAQYYLVGARMIVPFKDRLLFVGPVVQSSGVGATPKYLQDTVIYSQNGTPYYTSSFTGDPNLPTTVFNPILIPANQTATAPAYFEDQTGFGGFITAGIDEPINTTSLSSDVLIMGFSNSQARLVYSGNDIQPFNFYTINSTFGSSSTFSAVNMEKSIISRGDRGFILTSQTDTERLDLDIPDEVFQMSLSNNGQERICSKRDFINEWIYFTYPENDVKYKFPNETLQYNYRDNSWAVFREAYTTYGNFRRRTGYTWGNIGVEFPTWGSWNEPWNAGTTTLFQPQVIAGNQQGFVVFRDEGTDEANSLTIQSISGNIVTSPDHCLNNGDYIVISGALGTIGTAVNGKIFSVVNPTTNSFTLNPTIAAGTYFGGGLIQRMYVPYIQTKQFPTSWGMSRKVRIGVQQYLLTATNAAQVQLLIFLSQNAADPYNDGPIVPVMNSVNKSLIYSTVLYTCTESCNLGLTAANTNLQMLSLINPAETNASSPQAQIWHRINTSLIGDTVQLGFTMSDDQMRDTGFKNQFSEIELHGIILDVTPSSLLA
jgi:hypothetical protein